MSATEDLSVKTLSLNESETTEESEQLDAVRQSVISGDAQLFLATINQHKLLVQPNASPLLYLMEWFHTWQQEYEAFVHVLEVENEEQGELHRSASVDDDGDVAEVPSTLEKDLAEMESEAKLLLSGFSKIVVALLEKLDIKNPDSVVDRHGWTLVMQAANSGLRDLMDVLIANNADVNYTGVTDDATNPLYLAIESEHTDVAMLLLKNGAITSATKIVKTHKPSLGDKEEKDEEDDEEEEDCAFFQACRFGHLRVIEEMITLGVDLNFAVPSTGDRALHVAVMFEMQDVVELLLANDSMEVNAINTSGQTCLFGCSNVELAKFLISKGVDPNVRDIEDETAYSVAHALGDDDVAKFLETLAT